MTHKHTPGPWTTDTNGLITAGPRRLHIAQTAVTGMGHAAEANAFLLAAAPDLLDALIAADKWVAMYHDLPGHDAASQCMSRVIRAAISKALEG